VNDMNTQTLPRVVILDGSDGCLDPSAGRGYLLTNAGLSFRNSEIAAPVRGATRRLAQKMRITCGVPLSVAFLSLAVCLGCSKVPVPQEEPGLDVVIVYDTSGSMQDEVLDSTGVSLPKHVIGARALVNTIGLLEAYTPGNPPTSREVRAGLVVFGGGRGVEAVRFGSLDADAFHRWVRDAPIPRGSTPLGRAIEKAARLVMSSPLKRNHILVITDGMNTSGPDPEEVIPQIEQDAKVANTTVGIHFVAFDIDASLFDEIKKHGVTVVAASDEIQLNEQLEFILEQKILLESEELPATSDSLVSP